MVKVLRYDGSFWYNDTTPIGALIENFEDNGYSVDLVDTDTIQVKEVTVER